jgi:hypothetical protein
MKDYSNYQLNCQSRHSRKITVQQIKKDRLAIKNERRMKNGLPPKKTYAEI